MAIPSLTANECVGSFLALDPPFSLRSYDLYETWFDDNSSMTLAQAGNYKGAHDIEEYVKFVFPSSPYIATRGTLRSDPSFLSFDPEKRSCVMMNKFHSRVQMSEMVGNELFEFPDINTLEWRFDDQKVGHMKLYCAPLSVALGPCLGPFAWLTNPTAYTAHRQPEFPWLLLLCAVDARHRQLRLPDDA
eukprot:scaffold27017_cov61-Phaeocystis_antarctica.AAC.3